MRRLLICLLILLLCGCGIRKEYACEPYAFEYGEKVSFQIVIYLTAYNEDDAEELCPGEYVKESIYTESSVVPDGCDCTLDKSGWRLF